MQVIDHIVGRNCCSISHCFCTHIRFSNVIISNVWAEWTWCVFKRRKKAFDVSLFPSHRFSSWNFYLHDWPVRLSYWLSFLHTCFMLENILKWRLYWGWMGRLAQKQQTMVLILRLLSLIGWLIVSVTRGKGSKSPKNLRTSLKYGPYLIDEKSYRHPPDLIPRFTNAALSLRLAGEQEKEERAYSAYCRRISKFFAGFPRSTWIRKGK